jgi:general stress protein 26
MSENTYIQHREAIRKLQDLATDINICLFFSGPFIADEPGCRPMSTSGVDEEGTIWFLSSRSSDKNREIAADPHVKLYYSSPGKSIFLVVRGMADILYDREKIRELWNPLDRTWFQGGETDPEISLIRVKPAHAHYWDARGNRMVNFFRTVATVATGIGLAEGHEGTLQLQ